MLLKSAVNRPVLECNSNCSCEPARCTNRIVQLGPNHSLQVVETRSKGLGVITKTRLRSGEFVCEYAGEIIGMQTRSKTKIGLESAMAVLFPVLLYFVFYIYLTVTN